MPTPLFAVGSQLRPGLGVSSEQGRGQGWAVDSAMGLKEEVREAGHVGPQVWETPQCSWEAEGPKLTGKGTLRVEP